LAYYKIGEKENTRSAVAGVTDENQPIDPKAYSLLKLSRKFVYYNCFNNGAQEQTDKQTETNTQQNLYNVIFLYGVVSVVCQCRLTTFRPARFIHWYTFVPVIVAL